MMEARDTATTRYSSRTKTLASLPAPTPNLFDGELPWTVKTAREIATSLNVDPATFNAWIYRGVGPSPLRKMRRRRGRHRISRVLVWLAARDNRELHEVDVWRDYLLRAGVGPMISEMDDTALMEFILKLDPSAELADPI